MNPVPAPSTARGRASLPFAKSLGFTLVEMMVSLSIFAIITGIVLIRNNDFNSGILFSNLVYEIALSIREMQTYGISVKAYQQNTTQSFGNGYGVYFDKVLDTTTNAYSFTQFIDVKSGTTPPDEKYAIPPDEKILKFKLKPGNTIFGLYVNDFSNPVNDLSITYVRPEPNAIITANNGVKTSDSITKAFIIIKSPGTTDAVYKCIVVTSVGQISVQNSNNTGTSCTP